MQLSDVHVRRTALKLLRAFRERAMAEALGWCRHFAESGERAERAVWTRIAIEIRRARGEAIAITA